MVGPAAAPAAGPTPVRTADRDDSLPDHLPLGPVDNVPGGPARFDPCVELSKDEAFRLCDMVWQCERALRAHGHHALATAVGEWTDAIEARLLGTSTSRGSDSDSGSGSDSDSDSGP